ncbi:hypothetical protein MiYa_03149 [Microcystis aeruginosa NIES-2519]|uniref:Uncharacterized protein n=1 Tax=Microcystis aeruginosa NIES-2519 TaxID=2303981 RepID=A0A5A5REN7_MICAE|nr:hypothetical protein MiYa_03149 [Microcystis aeruginosa NIES-2519]
MWFVPLPRPQDCILEYILPTKPGRAGNRVSTAKRVNQHQQTSPVFERLLQHFRERIEGVFNEVQNTGGNLERLLRKKVEGLCVHPLSRLLFNPLGNSYKA